MDERVVPFRVGVLVLATFIITGVLVAVFGDFGPLWKGSYTVYIDLPGAAGLSPNSPVRKNGILIGRVQRVETPEESGIGDIGGVLVTARIDADRRLLRGDLCEVTRSLLGGDAALEFMSQAGAPGGSEPIGNGDLIRGRAAADPLATIGNLEQSLTEAIASVTRTSDEIGGLARRVSDLVDSNGEQVSRIVDDIEGSVARFRSAVANIDETLSDPALKQNFKQVIEELPRTLADARNAIGTFNTTVQSATRNLENLEGLTRPLGERGPALVANIDRATQRLDGVLNELETFGASLNRSEGTLGQLVNNPDLYHNLNDAVSNIEHLTRELRPILADVRVFTDKIARHPEALGVRGAIRPGAGVKE